MASALRIPIPRAVTAAIGNLEEEEWNGLPGSTSIPNFVKIS